MKRCTDTLVLFGNHHYYSDAIMGAHYLLSSMNMLDKFKLQDMEFLELQQTDPIPQNVKPATMWQINKSNQKRRKNDYDSHEIQLET